MKKSVAEIVKGLECCSVDAMHCGQGCPYMDDCHTKERFKALEKDALALIRRLDKSLVETEKLAQSIYKQKDELESKLNQAVEDIRMLGRTGEFICPVCAHFNHGEGAKGECVKCLTQGDGFRWRGMQDDT